MEIVVTQDNVVNGIFFQDEEMRRMYDRFPEILFVDATYKLMTYACHYTCSLSKTEMVKVRLLLSGW